MRRQRCGVCVTRHGYISQCDTRAALRGNVNRYGSAGGYTVAHHQQQRRPRYAGGTRPTRNVRGCLV